MFKRHQRHRREKAQTLVEFSLVMPIFLLFMFGMVDFAHIYFVQSSLLNALRITGRFSTVAGVLTNGGTQLSRNDSDKVTFENQIPSAIGTNNIPWSAITITSWPQSSSSASAVTGPGGASDFVEIQAWTSVPLLTPVASLLQYFTGTAVLTNSQSYILRVQGIFLNSSGGNPNAFLLYPAT